MPSPPTKNRFVVEVKKTVHEKLGAIIVRDIQGVRIDAIVPEGVLDKTKMFQLCDRIVDINGEDMTRKEVMDKKDGDDVAELFNATLDRHLPDLKFTVSRFTGAMLQAAEKDIAEEIAAKEVSGQKEIKDIEAAVREYGKEGVVVEKDGEEMSLSECPEIKFIMELGQLAVDIMTEAKLMFKRGTLNKLYFAPSYTQKLKNYQDRLNE